MHRHEHRARVGKGNSRRRMDRRWDGASKHWETRTKGSRPNGENIQWWESRVKREGCVLAWIVRKYNPVPTSGPTFDEAGNTMSHGHKVAKSTSDVGRRLTVSCFSRNAMGLEPSGAVVGIVVV